MQYLDPSEYVSFGLSADTADALVTAASALIDSACRRLSLAITQYVECLTVRRHGTVQLSYGPLAPLIPAMSAIVDIRVRMRRPTADVFSPLAFELATFTTAGTWTDLNPSQVYVSPDGLLHFMPSLLTGTVAEAAVTYTAGYAAVPVPVKVACAQIVRNAQATPALTVKQQRIDTLQLEYFSGTLLDADVLRLLQPYVAERVG